MTDGGSGHEARAGRRRRARRRRLGAIGAAAVLVVIGVGAAVLLAAGSGTSIDVAGPEDGEVVGPEALASGLVVDADGEEPTVTVDGAEVSVDGSGRVVLDDLAEGEHRITVSAGSSERSWSFSVDRTPPALDLDPVAVTRGAPATVAGTTDEPATVALDGARTEVAEAGRFQLRASRVTPGAGVTVTATDVAGNSARSRAAIRRVAREPDVPVTGVHVESWAWDDPPLRRPVLRMLERGEITAVQLDLKNEEGVVGYDSRVPRARAIGAIHPGYEIEKAIKQIHDRGGRVVGRVVVFRDPILASAAWSRGNRDQVLQTPSGQPYGAGYGGFTNYANRAVRDYNTAIIKEAAAAGVDEILLDYIRRPDRPTSEFVVPGMAGTHEDEIVGYVAEVERALAPHGTHLGASVFGVAAETPEYIAQPIPRMARHLDYVSPMVYPSHWGPGQYGVADPVRQPGDIVERSLAHFLRQVKGTGARVVPWLQDFTLDGVVYGPAEVEAQIQGAKRAGIDEWLLWNPAVEYTYDGSV